MPIPLLFFFFFFLCFFLSFFLDRSPPSGSFQKHNVWDLTSLFPSSILFFSDSDAAILYTPLSLRSGD